MRVAVGVEPCACFQSSRPQIRPVFSRWPCSQKWPLESPLDDEDDDGDGGLARGDPELRHLAKPREEFRQSRERTHWLLAGLANEQMSRRPVLILIVAASSLARAQARASGNKIKSYC